MTKNKYKEDFINKARKKHGDKYDYSKVEYVNIKTKVCIICPVHGEFWQTPNMHLRTNGCQKCTYETFSKTRRKTKEWFIEKARLFHGNKYDYSKVEYVNGETEVIITCPIHGDFLQKPSSHLIHDCPKCGVDKVTDFLRKDTETFIKEARLIHGNKYDYSKVNYVTGNTKVTIVCPKHGEFEQRPHNHLIGQGCKLCANKEQSTRARMSTREFIQKAKNIHGELYDYSKVVYQTTKDPVCIICKKHGDFYQIPNSHLSGHGCPKCYKRASQLNLYERLQEDLNINLDFDKHLDWLGQQSLDIYNSQYNFAIEYNGRQHYEAIDFFGGEEMFIKRCEWDNKKKQLCLENGCKLWILKYDYVEDDYECLLKEIKEYINVKNKK